MAYEKLSAEEDTEIAFFFNSCEELISVDECEPNSLVVLNDCVNIRQQHIIKDYFATGRYKNTSCVYLTQLNVQCNREMSVARKLTV